MEDYEVTGQAIFGNGSIGLSLTLTTGGLSLRRRLQGLMVALAISRTHTNTYEKHYKIMLFIASP